LSAATAAAGGDFSGRARIDISPSSGSEQWVNFMESQAPSERALAERRQESFGQDLEWMAGMAEQQGAAYVGDLQRQTQFLAFDRSREHNMRVQDRINQERMVKAQMEMQAQATNAQLGQMNDPFMQFQQDAMLAATMNQPGILAQKYGLSPEQAASVIAEMIAGLSTISGIG
jgi:hypothetical protein